MKTSDGRVQNVNSLVHVHLVLPYTSLVPPDNVDLREGTCTVAEVVFVVVSARVSHTKKEKETL